MRRYTNSDHRIDGEIEFKDDQGRASRKRLYVQLKSGDSYLKQRERDGAEVFQIKNSRDLFTKLASLSIQPSARTTSRLPRSFQVARLRQLGGVLDGAQRLRRGSRIFNGAGQGDMEFTGIRDHAQPLT